MPDDTVTSSGRTEACHHLLKDIEERLSKCTGDKNELAAVQQFINKIFANISDDNILTETEVEQWEILKAKKTDEFSLEDDPVYLCNDAQVLEKELELMEEERDENFVEVYDEIEWSLNDALKDINIFLSQLEQDKLEAKKSLELALEKYEKDSKNAFSARYKVIDDLKNIPKRIGMDQFLCELPLTALKEKFDCFLQTFETHLKNHFLETAKINGQQKCRDVVSEQKIFEKCLSLTLYENLVLQCLLKAQEAALSHINAMADAIQRGAETPSKTRIENELATLRNSKTAEDIIADFKNDLVPLSQMAANVQILKHILTICNSKYKRVNYWLLQTMKWTNCVKSEKKLINDILCVLRSEEEEASNVLSYLKDFELCLKREHEDAVSRTALVLTQLQNPAANEMLYSVFVNILRQFSTGMGSSTTLSWRHLEEAVIDIKKSNVHKRNKFSQLLKDRRNILLENDNLFKLIGDIKRYSGENYSQINIDAYKQSLTDSEKSLCVINQDFTEKQNTISTNFFLKHRRLLWVYFLCNEDKLAEVLSYLNKCLSDVSV